jgi:ATP-dependent Lhr-like helicase
LVAVGRLVGATPVSLFLREHTHFWQALRDAGESGDAQKLTPAASCLLDELRKKGASFFRDLSRLDVDGVDHLTALGELVAAGLVASDGFAGLRAIVRAAAGRSPARTGGVDAAGRWSLLPVGAEPAVREAAVEAQAQALLRRYGVVFHRLLSREATAAPWRELARVYRRLEARGEIRGGRFVSGMSGEQFAVPDAVERLREIRRTPADGQLLVVGATDPLNLAGVVTAGDRIRAVSSSRVAYRDGVPIAALEGDYIRPLVDSPAGRAAGVASALTGRRVPDVTGGYVGR